MGNMPFTASHTSLYKDATEISGHPHSESAISRKMMQHWKFCSGATWGKVLQCHLTYIWSKFVSCKKVWTVKIKKYPQSYRRLFPHVSEWGKVFLGPMVSRDWYGNCNTAVWPPRQSCFNIVAYLGRKNRTDKLGYYSLKYHTAISFIFSAHRVLITSYGNTNVPPAEWQMQMLAASKFPDWRTSSCHNHSGEHNQHHILTGALQTHKPGMKWWSFYKK